MKGFSEKDLGNMKLMPVADMNGVLTAEGMQIASALKKQKIVIGVLGGVLGVIAIGAAIGAYRYRNKYLPELQARLGLGPYGRPAY
jgi:hypothetical protein